MRIKQTLITLLALFSFFTVSANHHLGNEITFTHLGGMKYKVHLKIYRSCVGIALGNPSSKSYVRDSSGTQKIGLSFTRISIRNVSMACWSAPRTCFPVNTTGTRAGTEEHLYEVTVDFSKAPYDKVAKSNEPIYFVSEYCCRTTAITNGSANKNTFNYALLDLRYGQNSSPKPINRRINKVCCNQPVTYSFAVESELDGDSISYALVNPWEGFNTPTTLRNPMISAYYPGSIKHPYSNPNANPPIGFYLDPKTGNFTFTPTSCSDFFNFVVEITAWRKDATGRVRKSSVFRRDQLIQVMQCYENYTPVVSNINELNICVGDSVSTTISISDQVKILPPPNPRPDPDSLYLEVHNTASWAQHKITNGKGPNYKTVEFTFRPNDQDVNKSFAFHVLARDNSCPLNAQSSKSILVNVYPQLKATITSQNLSCNGVKIIGNLDSSVKGGTKYQWDVLDIDGRLLRAGDVYFQSTKASASSDISDTLYIKESGRYIVRLRLSNPANCLKDFFDTIVIRDNLGSLFSKDKLTICWKDSSILMQDLHASGSFSRYNWNNGSSDSALKIVHIGGLMTSRYGLFAAPDTGCPHLDGLDVHLSIKPGIVYNGQTEICLPFNIDLRPRIYPVFDIDSITWNGTVGPHFLAIDTGGLYTVVASNFCGQTTELIEIDAWSKPQFDLSLNKTIICDTTSTLLRSGIKNKVPTHSYLWDGAFRDSVYWVTGTGVHTLTISNACGVSHDTFAVTKLGITPRIDFATSEKFTVCHDNLLDVRLASYTPDQNVLWSNGYSSSQIRITAPNKVWVNVSNECGLVSDTLELFRDYPVVNNLPSDTFVCKPGWVKFDLGNEKSTYKWTDNGDTSKIRFVNKTGVYRAEVTNSCGPKIFSTYLEEKDLPVVDLGNDTIHDQSAFVIDARNPGSSYLWSTGETTQKIEVTSWGNYWVDVTNECGTTRGTIRVGFSSVEDLTRYGIRLYPNPTAGKLYLDLKEGFEPPKTIHVFGAQGQKILELTPTNSTDGLVLDLPVNTQVVFVQLVFESRTATVPVMIIHE